MVTFNLADMMNIVLIFMGLFTVLLVGLLIILAFAIKGYNDNKKALLALQRYEINVSTFPFGDNISSALESFIVDCFDDYKVKFLLPGSDGNPVYVTDEKESEIRKALVEIVSKRLSPLFIERLSLYYREDQIASIIADKIYLIVMNYAIETRTIRTNTDEQKIKSMATELISQ